MWCHLTFRPTRGTNELKEHQGSGTDAKEKVMVVMRVGRGALWEYSKNSYGTWCPGARQLMVSLEMWVSCFKECSPNSVLSEIGWTYYAFWSISGSFVSPTYSIQSIFYFHNYFLAFCIKLNHTSLQGVTENQWGGVADGVDSSYSVKIQSLSVAFSPIEPLVAIQII